MRDLQRELAQLLAAIPYGEGLQLTEIPGIRYIKVSESTGLRKTKWRATLSFIAQGVKEITLGNTVYRFGDTQFIASPLELPVTSRIQKASIDTPFLGIMIDIDPVFLAEVAKLIDVDVDAALPWTQGSPENQHALFTGESSEEMLEAVIRLVKILQKPDEARVLGPLLTREIFFYLLKSPVGPSLYQFIHSGSKMHRVSEAIFSLRSQLMSDLDVDSLARTAKMSRSAFFKQFKDVTSLSPIQYQKRLRLLEARRLMIEEGESAESSAYKVGYRSAPQFSREYTRMFGDAPFRDALKQRAVEDVVV